MIFRKISEIINGWINNQIHVKEESLTDWMLYKMSKIIKNIKYIAFNRHDEAFNGSDWEWWVLRPKFAYRFRIQAKKLKGGNENNRASIKYRNKNGKQIDLLLTAACTDNFYPLYLFYSSSKPENQLSSFHHPKLREMIEWCKDCKNGAFISPACEVYKLINNKKRGRLQDDKLLDISISLSSFDYFCKKKDSVDGGLLLVDKLLDLLNDKYVRSCNHNGFRYVYPGSTNSEKLIIPDRLWMSISNGVNLRWLSENPSSDLLGVDGIVIFDLREDLEYDNDMVQCQKCKYRQMKNW
ncbi:MAG: hypothetical protein LBI03_06450 [Clostridiales bacterium]|jgi:hypothetical protein|nr:hypothetical protein [Clostridiales bacterium]